MTALQLGALRAGGLALRFDRAHADGTRAQMPVIVNLFGTRARVAAGLGMILDDLPVLATLRAPAPMAPRLARSRATIRVSIARKVLGPDRLILRWLAHRGGAAHARTWARVKAPMPVAIALGADPATLLSAALPLPETVSDLGFSGVLLGARTELAAARTVPLMVSAQAEIMLEGWIHPADTAP